MVPTAPLSPAGKRADVGPAAERRGGTPTIRPMAAADLDGALALVAEAGWNQVRDDWQLFIDLGKAFVICGADGRVIASAATLPYAGFGWISMVLVAKAHRRRGLATRLLEHCIAQLRQGPLVPMLDATPAGRTVYQPQGFTDGWAITRWRRGQGRAMAPLHPGGATPRPLHDDDWPQVEALDAAAFGASRAALLHRLYLRSRGFACVVERDGRVAGFLLGRDGRAATQIGPIVAGRPGDADTLLAHALRHLSGPVLADGLDQHDWLCDTLATAGFEVERGYTRMALTGGAHFGNPTAMVAIAGPEIG